MSYKEKKIQQLRKGYNPIEVGPNEKMNSIFKNTFKPLVEKKDLEFFFELSETNEPLLRAWGFLGIYHILKERTIEDNEKKSRFHEIVQKLLNDNSEISYSGGSTEIQISLRDHHISRISELKASLVFDPVMDYVQSSESKNTEIIIELLDKVLSKIPDSRVESLIIKHATKVINKDFGLKLHIINAFENLGQNMTLTDKAEISEIFKTYLKNIEDDKTEFEEDNETKKIEIKNRKKKLQETIFRIAAVLDLDLEAETMQFLDALTYPYEDLYQIAKKYKNNEKFKSILLRKLNEINNPNFIKDILRAILILKENISNWKDIAIDNLNKYQIIDGDLIVEMEQADLYNEDMLIDFLNEGAPWQLEFLREFLVTNPDKLNTWLNFHNEFIKVLTSFKSTEESWSKYPNLKNKKELVLKLLIDLELRDMIEYCFENYKNLDDKLLRELCLFAIIKLGKEEILVKLKKYIETDKESAEFFKKFWRSLQNREWQFYY
ncbi:MAG: hypothetical protein ACFFAO_14760 [Candidatus Hermodarchaeota archaeon]